MMSRYNNGLKAKEALAQTAERTGAPTFLQVYDPEAFGGDGRAAIAIGDPDHADNIAIVVPGTGNLNFAEALELLKTESAYEGAYVIEYEADPKNPNEGMKKTLEVLMAAVK